MRTKLAILMLAMTTACGSADAPAKAENGQPVEPIALKVAEQVPPEITNSILDWSKCRSAKVLNLIPTALSDDAVVDQALEDCVAFERVTITLWEKHFGTGSGRQVRDLRARWRTGLITNVRETRAGKPLTGDPTRTWGICIGEQIPNPVPADVATDAIADKAFEACSDKMEIVRADIEGRHGATVASSQTETLRVHLRKLIIERIEAERSTP